MFSEYKYSIYLMLFMYLGPVSGTKYSKILPLVKYKLSTKRLKTVIYQHL